MKLLGLVVLLRNSNRNESLNKVAKAQANFSRMSWVQLHVPAVSDQHKEVERAMYKMGEYQLRESYHHLEVNSARWFKMTPEQRTWHLQKVFGISSIAFDCLSEHSTVACKSTKIHLSAAESMSCLEGFLEMFTKSKQQLNFTSLVKHNVLKVLQQPWQIKV